MNAAILNQGCDWGSKELPTSRFDRCFSWLLTLLLIASLTFAGLFLCWLNSGSAASSNAFFAKTLAINPLDLAEGRPVDTFPTLVDNEESALAGEMSDSTAFPDWENLLEAVSKATEIVASTVPDISEVQGTDRRRLGHRGQGIQDTGGRGTGVQPGGVSLTRRWRIEYQARSLTEYRGQLFQLGIVIGVVRQSNNEVIRVRPIGSGFEVEQSDRFLEAKSLYFGHQRPALEAWERRLVKEAGVDSTDSLIVQFVDHELQAKLLALETAFANARGKDAIQVRRTVFCVSDDSGQAEYVVREQSYR